MRTEKILTKDMRARLLAVIAAVVLVVTSMLPAFTERSYAADGTISLKVGRIIDYSSHFTNYFYAGDKDSPVYCSQPQLPGPESGNYPYSFLKPDSMLAKCLYYGYGGPGFDEYTDKKLSGTWDSADDAYCLTHIIISIAYDKTMDGETDPFKGLSDKWKNKAKSLYDYVKSLPDPPVNYKAYIIKSAGKQDILGSFNDVGKIRIEKSSKDTSMTAGNSAYSLAGAKYGVYYGSHLIYTLETDENGVAEVENVLVEDYTIKEISPSKGFAIDTSSHNCKVKEDATAKVTVGEQPKNAPVEIVLQKGDAETGKAEPQGGAKLEGAVYEVKFFKKGKESAERTWRVVTGADGIARLTAEGLDASYENSEFYHSSDGKICLPLGIVTIQEVKAPEGYLLNDAVYRTEVTAGSATSEKVDTFNIPKIGSAKEMAELPKRGDLKLVKVKDGNMQRLAGVKFRITSKTTGESHEVCTDENGVIDTSSSFNAHKQDTNGGTDESGLWFGEESAIDESRGALLYDRYTLDEISGDANQGLKAVQGVEFRIYRNSTVLDLGTVTDDAVNIGTTATDSDTKDHISLADNEVTIIDTVEYEGLQPGREYRMEGTLMEQEMGEPVMSGEEPVTAETVFTPSKEKGMVDVEFVFDATDLGGKDVVVFEKCFDVESGLQIASHEDIDDEGQTVNIPKIGTKAKGPDSKTNVIEAKKDQKITDTVSYTNLIPGKEYELVTWLTKDGKKIRGTEVKSTFTPEKADGEVKAVITLDGKKHGGEDLTVFEEVKLKGKLVAEHKDKNDKDQMIHVKKPDKPVPTHSPQTGDPMALKIWIAVALCAAFVAGRLIFLMKRKDK